MIKETIATLIRNQAICGVCKYRNILSTQMPCKKCTKETNYHRFQSIKEN